MRDANPFRRAALAAALALSLVGLDAASEAARAMPVAAAPAALSEGGFTAVQYYYGHRRYRYGRRHAGVYNCGRGALHTHLERKNCGFAPRGHNGMYRYR